MLSFPIMNLRPLFISLCLVLMVSSGYAALEKSIRNQLSGHPSPYLAMHGEDPVHWQSWSEDVLVRARAEGKLVFVSSGYFSCHWCHVMQRESYRDADIANIINKNFIPVKIDRELQPALDARLIEFVERTRGQAGWPLNVFLTPDGYPLFGFTYLPPQSFSDLLEKLQARWTADRSGLSDLARQADAQVEQKEYKVVDVKPTRLDKILVQQALEIGDKLQGGFGQQNKFPMAPQLLALLDVQARVPDRRLAEFLRLTLDQMAGGGLRDHLGGGFFRYSTTPDWQVPHFEKMLYDNALLVQVYLRAAELFNEPAYLTVARETLDFVMRELGTGQGTCVSSLSAVDSEGVEGGYYLWSIGDIEKVLDKSEMNLARRYYALDKPPALEHGYHLIPAVSTRDLAVETGQSLDETNLSLQAIRRKLVTVRNLRSVPVDTKVLSGWNGLMLEALVAGAQTFDDSKTYTLAAARLRNALLRDFWDGDQLWRARDKGTPLGAASLEDYAFLARGLGAWDAVFVKEGDDQVTAHIVEQGWRRFYKDPGWQMGEAMIIPAGNRELALADGPMPSPSAYLISVSGATRAKKTGQASTEKRSQALDAASVMVSASPFWYASYIALYH